MDQNAKIHILIVDDDDISILLFQSFLKEEGYNVDSAKSGKDAIVMVKKKYYDLIISDLVMPNMDGNQLVRSIRSMPEYSNVPFVFISGKKENDIWIKNLKDGADDYLIKPINRDIFISKINILLNRSTRNKESISVFQKQILELERGGIIYCNTLHNTYDIDTSKIKYPVFNILNEKSLFNKLNNENIWAILIDETANWAFKIIDKVIAYTNTAIPIYYFFSSNISESTIKKIYTYNIDGHILKYADKSLTYTKINTKLKRELQLKTKYLHALNQAAAKSPFNCKPQTKYDNIKLSIEVRHKCFNNIPGGDYYELYSTKEGDSLTIIGDVMGKSWNAWFIQPAYIAYLKSIILYNTEFLSTQNIINPQNILKKLNSYIYKDSSLSDVFATISIIGHSYKTNTIHISSAGALRPLYYSHNKQDVEQLNITGTVLGVLPNTEYYKIDIEFNKKDMLLFYTDGYTEARGRGSEKMIGHEPLKRIFKKHSLTDSIDTPLIENTLVEEENISYFDDDRTMLLFKSK